MTHSSWEDYLSNQLFGWQIPEPIKEYRFLPPRRFRFDFAWPDIKFAVEVDGNVYHKGRHTTGAGYSRDCEKFALAAIEGWRVIRVTTGQVGTGDALNWIKQYFDKQVKINDN